MKSSIVVLISLFTLTAAIGQTRKEAAPAAEPGKIEIPAGAQQSEDGSWHFTDSKGKKWVYRKTPFGIARAEENQLVPKPLEVPKEMRASEDGDSVQFERPGPFGTYKWTRKKSGLNEMEQAVWDREKARLAASKQE
jgi:hypothetical protein